MHGKDIPAAIPEAFGADADIAPKRRKGEIRFYGQDILKGNFLFRHLILSPDTKAGIKAYEKMKVSV